MSQWVQHISGVGEKWAVELECTVTWRIEVGLPEYTDAWRSGVQTRYFYLPKSEYRLCDPPEIWEDVTDELLLPEDNHIVHGGCSIYTAYRPNNNNMYRLRKVPLWTDSDQHQEAFIVEKKKS